MKKYIYATGLLALMAAATSCDKYDIYPEEFDSVFAIRDAGNRDLTVYSTDAVTRVPFVVMKGGYDPANSAKAELKTMSKEEFEAYKESSGNLLYEAVGDECYSFSETEAGVYSVPFEFATEQDKYKTATLYIRPAELKTWFDNNSATLGERTPCVPVILESETDTVSSYNNVSLVCVKLSTPVLSIDMEGTITQTYNLKELSDEGDNLYIPDGNFSIPCENPWGFTLNLVTDDQAIAAEGYTPLPAEAYTLSKQIEFAAGTTVMPLGLKIDLKKLKLNTNYAIKVAIDPENPVTWADPNNNPGDALEINTEKSVIYAVRVVDAAILEKVTLSTSNVTTNDQEPSEGPLSGLFDGDPSTFFHSGWSVANPREEVYASYLEITLPKAMSRFRFEMQNRATAQAAGYVKKVHLFGTNDTNNWPTEPFAVIDDMNTLLNGNGASASFGTDIEPYMSDTDIKYLRFCVMESGGGSLGTTTTGVFWNAAELVLYGF